jgi:GH25 family lysozyme M1 (1,4-beta-N-acetylmuramidase)
MADHWTIDVSRWQGWIDWAQVLAAGVEGAWIKCGGADGGYYQDSRWLENERNAVAAGMLYGSYFFASPYPGDAEAQARYAVGLGLGRGELGSVLDIEHNAHGMSPAQLDAFGEQFCAEVERLGGRRPAIVYSGAYFGVGFDAGHPIGHRPFWVANYGSNSPSTSPPDFDPPVPAAWADTSWAAWQFCSTARIPGVTENTVDQNTVRDWFWNELLGGTTEEPEDDVATRGLVRTKPGSAWALRNIGWNQGEVYFSTIEGSGAARWLTTMSAVEQECFWLGVSPGDTWLVDDIFMEERYYYEAEAAPAAAEASTMSATGAGLFAVVLVALLWIGLELGLSADWYDLTQWQIAAVVGVVVLLAAMVAAFVSAQGSAVLRAMRRRRPSEPEYRGEHSRPRQLTGV